MINLKVNFIITRMFFGAHLSITGGYTEALKRAQEMGANCLQIFSSPPRNWQIEFPSAAEANLFKQLKTQLEIEPVYFHTAYLINLASPIAVGKNSVEFLIRELTLAEELGIKGTIVHLGSYKGEKTKSKYQLLIKNIQTILEKTPAKTIFIIENAGNHKIGTSLEEIAEIVRDLGDERVRVCLDTCHLWSSGYDISTDEKLSIFLDKFDSLIGLSKLELWHCNDSRDPLGSFRDRHENIGQGTLGLGTFKALLNNKRVNNRPFIIETPGFEGQGPDKENLKILKSLVGN